ncbi:unnamed protein product, partial [Rotaria sp. Silwood2]
MLLSMWNDFTKFVLGMNGNKHGE